MKKISLINTFIILISISVYSQSTMIDVPFKETLWDFGNASYSLHQFMGENSIELSQGGIAVKDVNFRNGTIQVDINFIEAFSFPGLFFRRQDPGNTESFYIRPHQSGNPDAVQYTPVFNGLAGWQLYFGEGFWQTVDLSPNTWHTIRINVLDNQADIYFNDMTEPIVKVTDLKRELSSGEVGINSGPPVHFANFKYSTENPILVKREPQNKVEQDPGLITSWKISNTLTDSLILSETTLKTKGLKWDTYPTEESGLLNISRFRNVTQTERTVLANITIDAEQETTKELQFGYTDNIRVFVNGQIVYGGRNDYRSRDYRYLGSIGYFDAIYLPLKKGKNEVTFVVNELFGGWGLKAKLSDTEGITVQ